MFWSGIADEAGRALETQIRAHKELGWSHIELRQIGDTTLAYADDREFDRIRRTLDRAGMKVSCFASAIANWSRDVTDPFDKDVDELRRAIPRLRQLGTKYVRIMSYVNKKPLPEAEWRREALRRLKELARIAEDGGVVLLHENCHGWASESPENTNDMLAEVNSPALKLVFDTGNSQGGGRTSWGFYEKLDKRQIAYVHLKDMRNDGSATWPGEGDSSVRRILEDLFRRGYDGGISIEPHIAAVIHEGKESDPKRMYDSYIEYGRRAMTLVNGIRSGANT